MHADLCVNCECIIVYNYSEYLYGNYTVMVATYLHTCSSFHVPESLLQLLKGPAIKDCLLFGEGGHSKEVFQCCLTNYIIPVKHWEALVCLPLKC